MPTVVITTTSWELVLMALVTLFIGWILCDLYWTVVRSDNGAAAHFRRSNWLAIVQGIALITFAIIAVAGLMYGMFR